MESSFSVLFGNSNCGKSFWALDLAAAIATGRKFRNEHDVSRGAVVYVSLEGIYGMRNRVEAMMRSGLLDEDSPLFFCQAKLSMLDPENAARFTATIEEADRSGSSCVLVVIDTMARAMAGGDENSGLDMGVAMKWVDTVRDATSAAILLVHHSGKDASRGARGHSSLRAAIDSELEITVKEGQRLLTVKKQRDLEFADPMPFTLKTVDLGESKKGKKITSCVVSHIHPEPGEPVSPKSGRPPKGSAEDLLALLPVDSKKEWEKKAKEELDIGRTRFYDLFKQLDGRWKKEGGKLVSV